MKARSTAAPARVTRRPWLVAGALLTALLPARGAAQPQAFLVKDINTTPVIYSSNPRQFATVDATAFFAAETPSGSGLWRTDGTPAGTELVKTVAVVGTPVRVNRTLFFVGIDASGLELWKSDGTDAGTVLVKDINPGPASSLDSSDFVNGLTAAEGDMVFFVADDGLHGRGLWRSDGTAAGTVLLKDAFASWLAAAGGILLFAADEGKNEYELWRSDGTVEGTVRVKDINPGPAGSDPLLFTTVNGTVFFRARDAIHGDELWKTDGTETGTVMVSDINPGSGSSFPDDLTAVDGTLFFRAGDDGVHTGQLWKSDGTAAGTMLVAPEGVSRSIGLVSFAGTVLFTQDDGVSGIELWRSDGTAAGTVRVKDINPGRASSLPSFVTVVDGMVFFVADDGTHGAELWRSDGTMEGTVLVRDVNPGPAPSASNYSGSLVAVNDTLLFAADDGSHRYELWRSDGTGAGTTLVKDVWPGPATADASPASLTALHDTLVFVAGDGRAGPGLWSTDGTEAGTARVADLKDIDAGAPRGSRRPLAELGGRLLFGADDRVAGNELWSSDGTATGNVLVKDIRPGPDGALPGDLTLVGDALFFAADDGTHGRELWKSDGTGSGTVLVKDIVPGLDGSSPTQLTDVGGTLFFMVGTDRDAELWASDGTAAGTIHLQDFFFGTNLTDVAGTLYFTTGTRLWKSDGSAAGTVFLADFHPVSGQYVPNQLTAVGDRLFFAAKEPSGSAVRLWTTDGEHLMALRALDQFAFNQLTAAADRLFFSAADPQHGQELWTSDGSMAGTRLVRDINPGPAGSSPGAFSAAPGRLLFSACDADACRLWESDGTEAGTRPLADLGTLAPARPFVAAGSLAYFAATDFAYGAELRAAPLSSGDCTGDCSGDGAVTITELVRMVRLALGDAGVSCPTGAPEDTRVTIDALVAAVNNALDGCIESPPPTAITSTTATPTPTPTNPPGCCVGDPATCVGHGSFERCQALAEIGLCDGWSDDPCHCGEICRTPVRVTPTAARPTAAPGLCGNECGVGHYCTGVCPAQYLLQGSECFDRGDPDHCACSPECPTPRPTPTGTVRPCACHCPSLHEPYQSYCFLEGDMNGCACCTEAGCVRGVWVVRALPKTRRDQRL